MDFARDRHEAQTTAVARRWLRENRGQWERALRLSEWRPGDLPRDFLRDQRDELAAALFLRAVATGKAAIKAQAESMRLAAEDRKRLEAAAVLLLLRRAGQMSASVSAQIVADTVGGLRGYRRDVPAIQERIGVLFSPTRGEAIGITQTTAAASVGQLVVGDVLEEDGIDTEWVWITEEDGKVCPICRPFNRKDRSVWGRRFPGGPPGHPRCRCRLQLRWRMRAGGRGKAKIILKTPARP